MAHLAPLFPPDSSAPQKQLAISSRSLQAQGSPANCSSWIREHRVANLPGHSVLEPAGHLTRCMQVSRELGQLRLSWLLGLLQRHVPPATPTARETHTQSQKRSCSGPSLVCSSWEHQHLCGSCLTRAAWSCEAGQGFPLAAVGHGRSWCCQHHPRTWTCSAAHRGGVPCHCKHATKHARGLARKKRQQKGLPCPDDAPPSPVAVGGGGVGRDGSEEQAGSRRGAGSVETSALSHLPRPESCTQCFS